MVYSLPVLAHSFTGRIGFYDGISHPVLGLDHFLAMVSVGIVSAQIGGKAIWTVPATFVSIMTIGGLFGFFLIVYEFFFVEVGIVFSVSIYSVIWFRRLSGIGTTPWLGSIVQKGKFSDETFDLVRALKMVDFPTLGKPTIPTLRDML